MGSRGDGKPQDLAVHVGHMICFIFLSSAGCVLMELLPIW